MTGRQVRLDKCCGKCRTPFICANRECACHDRPTREDIHMAPFERPSDRRSPRQRGGR